MHGTSGSAHHKRELSLLAGYFTLDVEPISFSGVLDDLSRIGGDVDTIASIAGQVAGAHLGVEALPKALLDGLADRDVVEHIGDRFAGCGAIT